MSSMLCMKTPLLGYWYKPSFASDPEICVLGQLRVCNPTQTRVFASATRMSVLPVVSLRLAQDEFADPQFGVFANGPPGVVFVSHRFWGFGVPRFCVCGGSSENVTFLAQPPEMRLTVWYPRFSLLPFSAFPCLAMNDDIQDLGYGWGRAGRGGARERDCGYLLIGPTHTIPLVERLNHRVK